MIEMDSRPKQREKVLAQRAADSLVLLNLEGGQYYSLDEVGARVWELCDGTRTVAELVSIIGREYDAPAETVRADVLELLTELADESLVVEAR